MLFPNYHTHTKYCDGKGNPEEYIIEAINRKMPALGFSGHAPVPFKSFWNMTDNNFLTYLEEIRVLKEKYGRQIQIYLGIEADFIENIVKPSDFDLHNLDYIISAVHYLFPENAEKPWDFIISPEIFNKGLIKYYNNNISRLIKDYYRQINLLIENEKPHVIAHIDQIQKFNKNNRYFSEDEKFYSDIVSETLKLAAEKQVLIEINTRGKLKNLTQNFYPSNKFLKKCFELNIPIILSADAHKPEEINSYLIEAAKTALTTGYKEIFILYDKTWQAVELRENGGFI